MTATPMIPARLTSKRVTSEKRAAASRANGAKSRANTYLVNLQAGDYDRKWAVVTESRTMLPAEWNEFVNNLLDDRDWLAGKGGCEEQNQLVIAVRCGDRTIYVNPEGYSYARYVGFPSPRT